MQFAAIGGYIGIFEHLLEHCADPNAPCSSAYGRMPLEGAAEHGRFDMAVYILKLGPRPHSKVEKAAKLAKGNGHSAIVEVLQGIPEQTTAPLIAEPSNRKVHAYKICGLELSNASSRSRYERSVHVDGSVGARFSCEECGSTFIRKDLFERHKATHTQEGYVQCPSCEKMFRRDYQHRCQSRI